MASMARRSPGSQVHDNRVWDDKRGSTTTNRAGGLTGGVSNGEPVGH